MSRIAEHWLRERRAYAVTASAVALLLTVVACTSSSTALPRTAYARDTTRERPSPTVAEGSVSALPAAMITTAAGQIETICVEIADTEALQETGLMNRTSMPDDQGMAFLFAGEVAVPFWMKDTLIDLSIAFIGANGAIVDIQEMQAESLENHIPAAPYQFTIEANATWYARHGIAVGDSVDLSAVIARSTVFGGAQASPAPGP